MKKILLCIMLIAALSVAYLFLAPTPIQPVAWTPPPSPAPEGVYAANDMLKGIQKFGVGVGVGPEGIAVDAAGRIYAGYKDGRIVMFSANGASFQELAKSEGGHPLGITFGPNGGLVIADANKGLIAVGGTSTPKLLDTKVNGVAVVFADDVDNTRLDKNVYFTDAAVYDFDHLIYEFLEHKGTGRLLQYNVTSGETKVLMSGLHFANGVAVGPDDAYVLVTETAEYRVLRYWLKGDKAGTSEVFIDHLPGLPDNISYNDSGRFWLALYAPRDPQLDKLLPGPAWVKKLVSRLPHFLQPKPVKKPWVLGLDLDGKVVANLQYQGKDGYAPITSVKEWGPWLYFGSLTADSLARIPLNQVIPGSPPPPVGWEQTPATPHHFVPPKTGEDEEEEREERAREEREKAAKAAKPPG